MLVKMCDESIDAYVGRSIVAAYASCQAQGWKDALISIVIVGLRKMLGFRVIE